MFASLLFENILKHKSDYIFVDVRSPEEFSEATIPGAYNIPLFSNEERAEIGTLYKQEGREASTKRGIEFMSKSLLEIYNSFLEISKQKKKIAIFCARGGMRSTSIGSLLQSLGVTIVKIDYGYKGYRNFIVNTLPEVVSKVVFVPLYGQTGTGKTNILYKLEEMEYPVLDLEKYANHRGSMLGAIGLGKQNSQKMFESLVFDKLYETGSSYIFTEGESKRIGRIIMPNYLYDAIFAGKRILVTASVEKRIEVIYDAYIKENYEVSEMVDAINKLSIYIGEKHAADYVQAVNEGNFRYVIEELMIKYYDNAYKIKEKTFDFQVENEDEEKAAKEIAMLIYGSLEEKE